MTVLACSQPASAEDKVGQYCDEVLAPVLETEVLVLRTVVEVPVMAAVMEKY